MPDEIRRMRDDECLLLMRSEDPVIDKKYNLLHHPNVKYTPDAGGEPYVMPPDYMGDAVTITMQMMTRLQRFADVGSLTSTCFLSIGVHAEHFTQQNK